MPELPEVETIVRELAPRITNRHILTVDILNPRIVRHSAEDLLSGLPGALIRAVSRRGKFILIGLDRGFLTIHLGMTGQLLFDTAPGPHTRAIFQLDGTTLLYDDIRMFGSIELSGVEGRTAKLGADALNAP